MGLNLQQLGDSLGQALQGIGTYSAQAANQANAVSRQAQSAQGAFNQASANQANMLNDQAMQAQYGFNSAMMQDVNQYNMDAWNKAADYNREMWEKSAQFNREMFDAQKAYNTEMWEKTAAYNSREAAVARQFNLDMESSKYRRAVKDMAAAGLNPILAVTGGGISAGSVGGSVASTGTTSAAGSGMSPTSMSSAQGQMASGGLLGANAASESNYMGQMEYLSGTLGLISAVIGGLSSAAQAGGQLGDLGKSILEETGDILSGDKYVEPDRELFKTGNDKLDKVVDFIKDNFPNPINMINKVKEAYNATTKKK